MSRGRDERTRKIALYGMLIALAFIFSYIESMVPMPVPIPGVKLGIANLVNVVGLYSIGAVGTAAVSLIRILLVGFTFSNMFSMFYSLAGGVLSLSAMLLARRTGAFSKVGVSILGGIFHNIGQLLIAAFVTKTAGVFAYFPMLLVAGVITGAVIGLLGGMVTERISPMIR